MDLDFLYIESPTSRLTWGGGDQLGQVCPAGATWRGGAGGAGSARRGSVYSKAPERTDVAVWRLIRACRCATPSYQVEGARIVAQAVGRLMRTSVKMPCVQVMLDREIANDCNFSFLHDLPMGYELEQVVWCPCRCQRPYDGQQGSTLPLSSRTLPPLGTTLLTKARKASVEGYLAERRG